MLDGERREVGVRHQRPLDLGPDQQRRQSCPVTFRGLYHAHARLLEPLRDDAHRLRDGERVWKRAWIGPDA